MRAIRVLTALAPLLVPLHLANGSPSCSTPTPPDPMGPALLDVYPPDPVIPIEILALSLHSVAPPLDLGLDATDSGGPRGAPGRLAMVHAKFGSPPDDNFDPLMPMAFDVVFEVMVPGGTALHTTHFASGAGQALQFANVAVGLPQSPAVPLTFDVQRTPGIPSRDPPLFTATLLGTLAVPEPSALALLAAGGTLLAAAAPDRAPRPPDPHAPAAPPIGAWHPRAAKCLFLRDRIDRYGALRYKRRLTRTRGWLGNGAREPARYGPDRRKLIWDSARSMT